MLLLQLLAALELGVDNMPMFDSRLFVLPWRRVKDFLLRGDVFLIERPNIYARDTVKLVSTSGIRVQNNQ